MRAFSLISMHDRENAGEFAIHRHYRGSFHKLPIGRELWCKFICPSGRWMFPAEGGRPASYSFGYDLQVFGGRMTAPHKMQLRISANQAGVLFHGRKLGERLVLTSEITHHRHYKWYRLLVNGEPAGFGHGNQLAAMMGDFEIINFA